MSICLCQCVTVLAASSSIKSFSDNWLGQPQSSHPPGWMKENDIKTQRVPPWGLSMALRCRNPSPALDSPDIFSPEEAPGRRLTSSTTPRSATEASLLCLGRGETQPPILRLHHRLWVKIWHPRCYRCSSSLHPPSVLLKPVSGNENTNHTRHQMNFKLLCKVWNLSCWWQTIIYCTHIENYG